MSAAGQAGYTIGWHSSSDAHCHVSLDGDDLFDVELYEDDGESLAALRRMVASTLTPEEARAVDLLIGELNRRGYDNALSGPLAALQERLSRLAAGASA